MRCKNNDFFVLLPIIMVSYLQIEGLTKTFGDLVLYDKIDFDLSEGQRVAIVAKNGAWEKYPT